MSAEILFVTGTDTGVGKTVASAWLARREQDNGRRARYCKPVQTGVTPDEPGDAAFVARTAGVETHELLRFRDPLAPAVAAAREGARIDIDALVEQILSLRAGADVLLVEGAGGLLVPLTETHTMADLAAALGAPLVVVARPGLGTLNHIALTLEAAKRRALPIDALVISGIPAEPDLAIETNLARLRAGAHRLIEIPEERVPGD